MNKVSTVLKRLAAAVLASAMLLTLAGCGQRSQDDEVTKAQTEDVTTAEEQTSAPETSTEAPETEPTFRVQASAAGNSGKSCSQNRRASLL